MHTYIILVKCNEWLIVNQKGSKRKTQLMLDSLIFLVMGITSH